MIYRFRFSYEVKSFYEINYVTCLWCKDVQEESIFDSFKFIFKEWKASLLFLWFLYLVYSIKTYAVIWFYK